MPDNNRDNQPTDGQEPEPVLKPPAEPAARSTDTNPAADMIRQKLASIYADEPAAKAEIAEVKDLPPPRSRHQQFMYDLNRSGKPLSQIQAEWHQYYLGLDDQEKRQVWQEFYANSANQRQQRSQPQPQPQTANPLYVTAVARDTSATASEPITSSGTVLEDERQPDAIRQSLRQRVDSRAKLKVKHHLQSLAFGLGFGGLVILIVLFSFFNEVVIAPFIQPSRTVSATPIIVSSDGVAATDKNEVIIPKINLEIPLDFTSKTIDEKEIEKGLDNGVVHYPTTSLPGQQGNAAFFGHSSNNIFNPGKYKFAFVLLHELQPGDTFYLTYDGVVYSYLVYDKKIVEPTDVGVLNPVEGKKATATLITCDPPGTSLRRLVVWGEQTSPNPNSNVASQAPAASATQSTDQNLPGNGPTLWKRLVNAITGD